MSSLFERSRSTRVVVESGGLRRLGALAAELGLERVLLVTDPGVVRAGHVAVAEVALEDAGITFERFDDVHENPTTHDVERCAVAARRFGSGGPDGLVGLGGGSAIDVAKGANFLLCCGGRMQDYQGRDKATADLLPLIAVPTTAGTGTEVQSFALIADPDSHQKMACGDRRAAPRVALLDAELTRTLPRSVAACTGMDAIGHAVESAVTTAGDDSSRAFAFEAFERAARSLQPALARPDQESTRSDLLQAAALAGLAIEHSMLGAAHSMANPLTAHHGLPHGQAVGLALPHVVRFNTEVPAARATYARLARDAGLAASGHSEEAAARALADALESLAGFAFEGLTLRDLGLRVQDVAILAEEAARQWTARFNPRPVTAIEFEDLFRTALGAEA